MAAVHIISESKVQIPSSNLPSPGSTTQLSFFDVRLLSIPFMQSVYLYPNATFSPSLFSSFKSSLALTLHHFHPFVGDLTYLTSSKDVTIICSKDSGVITIEAESELDIWRLCNDITLDVETFQQLLPIITAEELPVPVLRIQLTAFSGGGISVGIASHHAAMDGRGLFHFVDSWAKTCRDGAVPSGLTAVHDRAVIVHPDKEELKKTIFKLYAPNIPKINTVHNRVRDHIQSTRFFNVHLSSVQILKKRIANEATIPISATPTTFEALIAHVWISMARAKGITSDDLTPTLISIPMDCRALINPPVSATYTGNCVRSVFVQSTGTSLMSPDGLSKTWALISKTICKAKKQPLGVTNMDDPTRDIRLSFNGLKVLIAGWPRYAAYETDFGWGKPHLHLGVPNMKIDGVYMNVGREEATVQLTVTLQGGMEAFVRAFDEGFQT